MGDGRDTAKLAELIERHEVTSFMGIPTIVSDLLHHHHNGGFDASSLRVVIASGAPVTDDLLKLSLIHISEPTRLLSSG